MAKKRLKEGKMIKLEEIFVAPGTMSRQSLVELVEKGGIEAAEPQLQELMASMKSKGQIECIGVRGNSPKEIRAEHGKGMDPLGASDHFYQIAILIEPIQNRQQTNNIAQPVEPLNCQAGRNFGRGFGRYVISLIPDHFRLP